MKFAAKRFILSCPQQFALILVLLTTCVRCIHYGDNISIGKSGGFIVQLYYYDDFVCGGSLIHELFVLTAQHCIKYFKNPIGYKAVAGANFLYTHQDGKSAHVRAIKLHPNYNKEQSENDIAVLMLQKPLQGSKIKPVPLCSKPYEDNDMGQLLGWGENQLGQLTMHDPLQVLTVPIMNWKKCKEKMLPKHGDLHEGMICTFSGNEHGVCNGDSGGPLIVNEELCGVIIWYANPGCANGVIPDIHTDVYYNRKFIKNAMSELKKSIHLTTRSETLKDSKKSDDRLEQPNLLINVTIIGHDVKQPSTRKCVEY